MTLYEILYKKECINKVFIDTFRGFPGGSDCQESACNVDNPGLIPESGRSPGEGNGYPLQ